MSSDGRWLAYSSNETGREEVYVRPFPDVDSGRATISIDGGSNPQWAHGASELFYFDSDRRLIAVSLQTDPEFTVVSRQSLFTLGPEYLMGDGGADYYDIAPDDQRFLVGRVVGATSDDAPRRYVVVQNFFEELKQRMGN